MLEHFDCIASVLDNKGFTLRSGGAKGADSAFENGCDRVKGLKEIYLPRRGFENSTSQLYNISSEAMKIAATYHPYWYNLSQDAQKLQARNSYQVLGYDLNTPSNFVICYTKGGKGSGGTGQAIRIAKANNIPVFDFGAKGTPERLQEFIDKL